MGQSTPFSGSVDAIRSLGAAERVAGFGVRILYGGFPSRTADVLRLAYKAWNCAIFSSCNEAHARV